MLTPTIRFQPGSRAPFPTATVQAHEGLRGERAASPDCDRPNLLVQSDAPRLANEDIHPRGILPLASARTYDGASSRHPLPPERRLSRGQPARARTGGAVARVRRDRAGRPVAEPAGRFRHRTERRPRSRRKACREDRVDPAEHQIEVDDRSVTKGVDRKRPGRPGGSAGFEHGRDVRSPVRLIHPSDQQESRNGGRRPCGARVVAAALMVTNPATRAA